MAGRTRAVVVLEGDGLRLTHSRGPLSGSEAAYEQLFELMIRTDRRASRTGRCQASRLSPDAAREPKRLPVRMECWKLAAAQMALKRGVARAP